MNRSLILLFVAVLPLVIQCAQAAQPVLPQKWTYLHQAAKKNDSQWIQDLLEGADGQKPRNPNRKEPRHYDTPLHIALKRKCEEATAAFLSDKRTSPFIANKQGDQAFHTACRVGFAYGIQQLLALEETRKIDPNAVNEQGELPILLALTSCSIQALRTLLASPRLTHPTFFSLGSEGQTLLHVAVIRGHRKAIEALTP